MLFMLLTGLTSIVSAQVNVTLTLRSNATTGSFYTGSVNATGVKNDGNMSTINSTANRGWARYDLSFLPAGATIISANVIFTTYASTLSGANNPIYGFTGDPASMAGTALYAACGSGTAFNSSSWTATGLNTKAFNATGITFLQNNLGNFVNIGFVRGSTNTYNIYGYPGRGANQDPKLVITYSIPSSVLSSAQTLSPSNLLMTSVTLSGGITAGSAHPDSVSVSGILLSSSPGATRTTPGVVDSISNPHVNSGRLSINFSGLTPGVQYYYRAYVVDTGAVFYGGDSTFTTPTTAPVPTVSSSQGSIQAYTATIGGTIVSNGGATILTSGVVYSTSPNPAIGNMGVVDSTTNPVVLSGSYSFNVGGLTPNTKYYFRSYASNSTGVGYSAQDSFTTQMVLSTLPYFENLEGSSTPWTAVSVGTGTNDWRLGTPAKTFLSGAFSGTKAYVTLLTGQYSGTADCAILSPQMDFSSQTSTPILRFKQKMDTDGDIGYDGGIVEISINNGAWTKLDPVMGTGSNFNTTNSTGWYNDNSGWGNLGAPMFSGITTSYSTHSNGWVTTTTPLTGATGQSNVRVRFHFWADGITDEGWAIDDIEVFAPSAPTVSTGTKTNVTTSNATLAGNITNNGGSAVTASGIVFSTSPSPVRGGLGVTDSATNPLVSGGAFTVNVGGLSSATTYYYRAYAVNSIGTSYGPDSSFTTNASAVAPTISRIAATNVLGFTATVGGNITSDGGSPVTLSGIVYGTSPNPSLGNMGVVDSTTNPLVTMGSFTKSLGGLNHSTKYYFRAYATNGVGTSYSAQDSFTTAPVITTLPYNQNFDAPGNTGWTSNIVTGTVNDWEFGTPSKTFINGAFSAPNAFVTKLTGNYAGSDCAVLSPQLDFTSQTATPLLRFKHKFDTDSDFDWDGGIVEISINGGAWTRLDPIVGTGANFNTTNSSVWYNNNSASGPVGAPKFSNLSSGYSSHSSGWITSTTPLTGAAGQSNVKVRFRFGADAFGTDEGWAIDNIEIFAPSAPSVVTGTKTNITTSNATLAGNITNNGGIAVSASGVVFSTSPSPVRGGMGVVDSATNPLAASGTFSVNITGLNAATTYYYRAYAVNGVGTTYGADSSFTTNSSAVAPTVVRVAASNMTVSTATVGGNITSDGGSAVTVSGVVYSSTNNNPTLLGAGVTDSSTNPLVANGAYSFTLGGLTHTTKYYFRAYATNGIGTSYSAVDSFETQPIISTLPYFENLEGSTTPWTSVAVGGTNDWRLGTPAKTFLSGAFSGTKAFATLLTGSYSGTANCAVLSPQMDFTSQTATPILRFKQKMDTDADIGYDGGIVEISINGGAWTKLDPVVGTGGNYNTANSTGWYNDNSGFGALGAPMFSGITTSYNTHSNGWVTSSTPLTGAAGQSNVRVRFRFWADGIVDEGWAIDDIEVFAPSAPTVATGTKSGVTPNLAALAGNISNNGGLSVTASGIVMSTTPTPVRGGMGVVDSTTAPTVGSGSFSVNIAGLTPSTTYYYRAYAVNGVGTSYGADSSFTTPASALAPFVSGVASSNFTTTSARIGGNITSNGGAAVTASGVVYSATNNNPQLAGVGVIDSTTSPLVSLGVFNITVSGLTHSTKYYYRPYATNSVGTTYGPLDSFLTSPIISTLPYTQDFDGAANTGWEALATGGLNPWELGTPSKPQITSAFNGTKAWVTLTSGAYPNGADAAVVSPQFNFTALTANPIISFWHNFGTESGWDGGILEVSTNGGTTWNQIDATTGTGGNMLTTNSANWYNGNLAAISQPGWQNSSINYTGHNSGWVQSQTVLTGVAGQANVKVRFRFVSDGSQTTTNGWAVDQVQIFSLTTPTVQASNVTLTSVSNDSLTVNWANGNGTNRLVVARLTSTGAIAPVNGVLYNANRAIRQGDSVATGNYVVYKGSGTSVTVKNLAFNTNYTFTVYEMNGTWMHTRFMTPGVSNAGTTLPVSWLSFTAQASGNSAVLNWSTASEVNNAGFDIERSADGKTFEKVGFAAGKGNVFTTSTYQYIDADVFNKQSVWYYRIKQTDADGTSSYTNVVKVAKSDVSGNIITVSPNPFKVDLGLTIDSKQTQTVQIVVTDMQGREISSRSIDAVAGPTSIVLSELNEVQDGVYFVKALYNGTIQTTKVVKMK